MSAQEAAELAMDALDKAMTARDLAEQAEAELLSAIKGLGGQATSSEARTEWIKMRKRLLAAIKASDAEVDGDAD